GAKNSYRRGSHLTHDNELITVRMPEGTRRRLAKLGFPYELDPKGTTGWSASPSKSTASVRLGSPDLPREADATYGHLPAATSSSFRMPARSPSASDAPTRMTSFSTANGLQAKLTRALPGPGYFASTICGSSSLACSAATAKPLLLSPSRIRW